MINEKDYAAAILSPSIVSEIKLFEEELSEQSNKQIIVIAYEKDQMDGPGF